MKLIETLHLMFNYKTYQQNQEEVVEKTVLNDVSLEINQGDFVGILGHNGSGKSTLAKQLTALLQPTGGTVYIGEMDASKAENILPIRKMAGMVFQNPDNQIVGNVVMEDVAFGPENLGVPADIIWERISEALEAVGMEAYKEFSPTALSGGQKQKVAIAGILAMEPKCIVFDEPTAMLDPKGRKEVLRAIRYLNQHKGITVIYITHHIDEVKEADYLYVMDQGKIALQGTPAELWKYTGKLKEYGVLLPFEQELRHWLEKGGMTIPAEVATEEQMLDFLCGKDGNEPWESR